MKIDLIRLVFDRLNNAGIPNEEMRASIYELCRVEVASNYANDSEREKVLAELEKVIRRQEMQAIHEELHGGQ